MGLGAWADGLRFGYCEDQVSGVKTEGTLYGAVAIRIPADKLAQWQGDQITGVSIGFGSGRSKDYTLFLSHDLGAEPFYTQSATVRRFKNWNDTKFAEALDIDSTQDLYVGYYLYAGSESDFMIGTDATYCTNDDAALMSFAGNDNVWGTFEPKNRKYGAASIRLLIEGENLPRNEMALGALDVAKYVTPGEPFDVNLRVRNTGANDVSSVKLNLTIGDETQARDMAVNIPACSSATLTLADCLVAEELVPCPVKVELVEVNGVERQGTASTVTAAMQPLKRTLVAELAFAYNAGYCVRGLQGCQEIRKNYSPNDFFCILEHEQGSYYFDDNLSCETYVPWCEIYRDALPQGSICRENPKGEIAARIAGQLYRDYQQECYYRLGLSSEIAADGSVVATATVFPAYDNKAANLGWTFVLTEDKVGPHWQYNSYANGNDPYNECPDYAWEDEWLKWTYDDVARYAEQVLGIPGSLPDQLLAGHTYEYQVTLPTDKVTNINNCNVSALLLDLDTGIVVNAIRLRANGEQIGVEQVSTDPQASAAAPIYYDLQGRRVANPRGGIFIKVEGNQSRKVKM